MTWLKTLDHSLFRLIHERLKCDTLDGFMPVVSSRHQWIPAIIILAGLVLALRRWKGIEIILMIVLTTGLCDLASSRAIKPIVKRTRPIPSGSWSFPSSHAACTAGAMAVLSFYLPVLAPMGGVVVLAIGYSRIYLGAHYPSDVAAGWILGLLMAILMIWIRQRLFRKDNRNIVTWFRDTGMREKHDPQITQIRP